MAVMEIGGLNRLECVVWRQPKVRNDGCEHMCVVDVRCVSFRIGWV